MAFAIIIPVLFLKFTLPLLIYFFPFQASWLNFILDTSDGDILMHFGLEKGTYQLWDKAADYVTYIAMLVTGMRWEIRKTIIFLFILRTVGQSLFFSTGNDTFLFFFPNFLEPLFMIYALLLFSDKKTAYRRYKKYFFLIWAVVIIYKMWNEYNIHIARVDLSAYFFGFNN